MELKNNQFFLKGNIPSSKNSKVMGKFFSKTVMKFLRSYGIQSFSSSKKLVLGYKTIPMTFPVAELKNLVKGKEYPLKIGFHFIRGSKHKWDFINAVQLPADLMTAFKIIEDDNTDCFLPYPLEIDGEYYSYSKENPGVIIQID